MKPYFLACYNVLRFGTLKLCHSGLKTGQIMLLGRNTRIVLGHDCRVKLGDRMISDGRMVIIVDKGAKLSVGEKVYFNEGAMISCKGTIQIGDGCKFGPNVKIFDNNHKFNSVNGVSDAHSIGSIEIGEKCWIGANVVILKGTRIGRNCVIGAGCIVSGEIPEGSIVTQERNLKIEKMRE